MADKLAIPAAMREVNPDWDDAKHELASATRNCEHEQAFRRNSREPSESKLAPF
jgi:hypothetical protein